VKPVSWVFGGMLGILLVICSAPTWPFGRFEAIWRHATPTDWTLSAQ